MCGESAQNVENVRRKYAKKCYSLLLKIIIIILYVNFAVIVRVNLQSLGAGVDTSIGRGPESEINAPPSLITGT